MTTGPLAYFWGDDELVIGARSPTSPAGSATEAGAPLERWDRVGGTAAATARRARRAGRDRRDVRGRHAGRRRQPGLRSWPRRRRASSCRDDRTCRPGNALVSSTSSRTGKASGAKGPVRRRRRSPRRSPRPAARRACRERPRPAACRLDRARGARARHRRSGRAPPRSSPNGSGRSSARATSNGATRPGWRRRSSTSWPCTARPGRSPSTTCGRSCPRRSRARSGRSAMPSVSASARPALELLDRLLDATPEPVLHRGPASADPGAPRDRRTGWRRGAATGRGQGDGHRQRIQGANVGGQSRRWARPSWKPRWRPAGARRDGQGRPRGRGGSRRAARAWHSRFWVSIRRPAAATGAAGGQPVGATRPAPGRPGRSRWRRRSDPRPGRAARSGPDRCTAGKQSSHRPAGMPKHSRSVRSGSRKAMLGHDHRFRQPFGTRRAHVVFLQNVDKRRSREASHDGGDRCAQRERRQHVVLPRVAAPTVGSQPNWTEKICISSMPSANAGNEMPETARVMPTRSGQRLRQTAETMPIIMPNGDRPGHGRDGQQECRPEALGDFGGNRTLVRSERRRSPRHAGDESAGTAAAAAGRGRDPCAPVPPFPASRPRRGQPGGSPGSRWTNRNTSTPTISSVGISPRRRLRTYWSIVRASRARAARLAPAVINERITTNSSRERTDVASSISADRLR